MTIFAYIAQWFREWRAKCKAVAEIRKLQRNLDALTVGKATASDVLDGWILEANPKCKKCRGRGYASYQRDKTTPIPCSCARAVRNTDLSERTAAAAPDSESTSERNGGSRSLH